jgi:glyoxylase-like metal-dependent hydrolase (beta-lactamase superfamily II)
VAARAVGVAALLGLALAACREGRRTEGSGADAAPPARWCDSVPRAANAALRAVDAGSEWFQVFEVAPGTFAITEPRQFQEAISYLLVGSTRALLWDSGIGAARIRPVVERLTRLPVSVLNSHTHFDHVGGNWEFDDVWGMDTPYTREHEGGTPHAKLASEAAPDALCTPLPAEADTAGLAARPWTVTRRVGDGTRVDLGGRVLEVLGAPGHTPDALALLDRGQGLLLTGDTYYDGTLWLWSAETDFDAYEATLARLVALGPAVKTLLPAHNTATVPATRLATVLAAFRTLRAGGGAVTPGEGNQVRVRVGDVTFLTSQDRLPARRP